MSRTHLFLALALAVSAASACDEALDSEFDTSDDDIAFRPGFGGNGLKLNTHALGDHPLHEIHRLGKLHENVQLIGVYLKQTYKKQVTWIKLDEQWSEKGQLYGRYNGVIYKGAQFTGSRWELATYGGGVVNRTMYIHSYRFDEVDGNHKYVFGYPNDAGYGANFYTKKVHNIKETSLQAACGNINGEGIEAVAVCGIATNICCYFAASDLRRAGFRVVLVEDASAGIDVPAAGLFQSKAKEDGLAMGMEYVTLRELLAAVREG